MTKREINRGNIRGASRHLSRHIATAAMIGYISPMKPSDALNLNRRSIRRLTERFGLKNPRVFGSALKGTDTETSDLDLLIEPRPETTLFDICGLQVELEEQLGVRVDVLTPDDLLLRFRDHVVREAIAI